MQASLTLILGFFLTAIATLSLAQENPLEIPGTFELHSLQFDPEVVVAGLPFSMKITGFNINNLSGSLVSPPDQYTVEVFDDDIYIEFTEERVSACLLQNQAAPPNLPQRRILEIPALEAGEYTVRLGYTIKYRCFVEKYVSMEAELRVYPWPYATKYFFHETPAEGQVVSGVGLIRGWTCYNQGNTAGTGPRVSTVSYSIDDGPRVNLAYGSVREDTAGVCGENNVQTGYSAALYWGNLGTGEHEFTLYVDGQETTRTVFIVEQPSEGFLTGQSGSYWIPDFPNPGSKVRIEWSEAAQNFIIEEFQ